MANVIYFLQGKNIKMNSHDHFSSFSNKYCNDHDSYEFGNTINFDYNEGLKSFSNVEQSQLNML